jgi:hypothetical protein
MRQLPVFGEFVLALMAHAGTSMEILLNER